MTQTAPNTHEETPRAVILGAGVAGLAAALRLGEAGCYTPLLLEREACPGGLARSLHFKGVSTDLGPHRIFTEIPEVAQLIEQIAAPSLYTVRRRSHMYLHGHFLPYPPSPVAMARRLGVLRMGRFGASYLLEKLRTPPAAETYESLMRRAFGKALYDYLIGPYTAKTWKTDPAQLHADTARVRVSAGSLAKMASRLLRRESRGQETALQEFRYVRGGAETLVRHLWEHARDRGAQLRLETEVTGLELNPDGTVRAARIAAPGTAAEALPGAVFLSTLPLPVLLNRLMPAVPALQAAREAAEGLQYIDMIFVCLIVRRKVITGDNWLYFPEPQFVFNRAYEAKSMDPGMATPDRSVICLEITLRRGDPLWTEDDAAIERQVIGQVTQTGLFGAGEVEEALVYRIPYAYPLYLTDYDRRLETALEGLKGVGNLVTLGRQGLFNHNNMDHSICMGLEAGTALNSQPLAQAVERWYGGAKRYKNMRIVD